MKGIKIKFWVSLIIFLNGSSSIFSQDTVQINNQVWMTKNLSVDKFRNGDPIREAKSKNEWNLAGKEGVPAWCYYDNDSTNGVKYGKLYNWYAVNDVRGLAPLGWHVPSNIEWTHLADYLGGHGVAGIKMKSINGWKDADNKSGNGTNESGIYCLPSGFRNYDGSFDGIGTDGHWWSSKDNSTYIAWFIFINNRYDIAGTNTYLKEGGFSLRCLRDAVLKSN